MYFNSIDPSEQEQAFMTMIRQNQVLRLDDRTKENQVKLFPNKVFKKTFDMRPKKKLERLIQQPSLEGIGNVSRRFRIVTNEEVDKVNDDTIPQHLGRI